jgi:hypothetical protein
VLLVEQELPTPPEHLSSSPVFSGVRVTRYVVVYVCFVDRCLSFCTFLFGHCAFCSSSIYGFWLLLWYLFGQCTVCSSSIYGFWLLLWYLLGTVLSGLLRYTDSDYLPLVTSNSSNTSFQFSNFCGFLCVFHRLCPNVRGRAHVLIYVICVCLRIVEQELPTLPEHLSSPPFLVGSCFSIFSFMSMFCRSLFVLLYLAIVLSVLLRYTDSDYRFGIFKLFL